LAAAAAETPTKAPRQIDDPAALMPDQRKPIREDQPLIESQYLLDILARHP
jgi:hypothetical protein